MLNLIPGIKSTELAFYKHHSNLRAIAQEKALEATFGVCGVAMLPVPEKYASLMT